MSNFRWHFQVFQKSAGPEWNPWPKDCLRHSYGSYHLARFRHAGDTAENMGHRSTDMLYKHYRDVIKEQGDIDAFWKLIPSWGVSRPTQAHNMKVEGSNPPQPI